MADRGDWTGEVLMDDVGRFFFVRYVAANATRAWVCLDPATGNETSVVGKAGTTEFLASPFGVDGAVRAYGASGTTFARIATSGELDWRMQIDNVVLGARDTFALSAIAPGTSPAVDVTLVGPTGNPPTSVYLPLPEHLPTNVGGWRLIGWSEGDGFVVVGDSLQEGAGVLVSHFDTRRPSRCSVRRDGAALLPVLGPDGVHLVAILPEEQPKR